MSWHVESSLPIKLAIIHVDVISVTQDKVAYQRLIQCAHNYQLKYERKSISEVEGVEHARCLFHAIGIDPTKHRPASEALLKRALKRKNFYAVNTLVDISNWCSLDFLLPTSVYDANKVKGKVIMRKGKQNDSYVGLNNRIINLNERYLISDEIGPFGSPITDSKRTAVDLNTVNSFLGIFAPANYNEKLLNEKANIFTKRVQNICGGIVKNIKLLSTQV
jgi:DNA/RNA-binding domain of Phe-tRNA-synthetase-like protein